VAEAQARLSETRARFLTETSKERNEAELRAAQLAEQLTGRNDKVARRELRAPMDGVVNRLLITTVGGVVKAGETIMEVVPAEDRLLINARVKPSDIAFLKPGQEARIRISAYDSSIFGTLPGKVLRVGADAMVDGEEGDLLRGAPRIPPELPRRPLRTPHHLAGHGRRRQHPDRQAHDDGVHAQAHRQDPRQIPARTLMSPPPRPTRLAACCSASACLGQAHAEPLPAVVDKVLLQQPSVRSAQALLRAAEAQITQVRSDFLPSLGLSYRNADSRDETQGRPLDRNIRRSDASLRWNIFNGAADTARLRAGGFYRDAADADLDNVLEQVAYEITENYTDVVRLRQTMDSLQATIAARSGSRPTSPSGSRPAASPGRTRPDARAPDPEPHPPRPAAGPARHRRVPLPPAHRRGAGAARHPGDPPADGDTDIDALVERIHERNPRLRAALQRAAARKAEVGVARGSFFPAVDLSYSKRLDNTTIPVPVSDTDRAASCR
jgi:hypothetical protein